MVTETLTPKPPQALSPKGPIVPFKGTPFFNSVVALSPKGPKGIKPRASERCQRTPVSPEPRHARGCRFVLVFWG